MLSLLVKAKVKQNNTIGCFKCIGFSFYIVMSYSSIMSPIFLRVEFLLYMVLISCWGLLWCVTFFCPYVAVFLTSFYNVYVDVVC